MIVRPTAATASWPFRDHKTVAQITLDAMKGRCICLTERPYRGAPFTQIITPAVGCPYHDKRQK